jgi:hypothetical protein
MFLYCLNIFVLYLWFLFSIRMSVCEKLGSLAACLRSITADLEGVHSPPLRLECSAAMQGAVSDGWAWDMLGHAYWTETKWVTETG